MKYIEDGTTLTAFAEEARGSKVLALDTEFLREKTYYPKACLIQAATDDEVWIIDPLAVEDLSPLGELLEDESIVKVLHAATQDIEILLRITGSVPWPLFDTQAAAALLGYSHQVGLAQLVGSICGVTLKKSDSYTDWARRPLSASQLEYAAGDVVFLPELYERMCAMLQEKGRLEWLEPDFLELVNADHYVVDPRKRYRHLKRGNQLSRRQLGAAREVAAWRERRAQEADIPRKWVLSDEQIVEACRKEARTIDELFLIRGMREKLSTRDAREVAALMVQGHDLPEGELPVPDRPSSSEPNVDSALDMMLALTRVVARDNDIAMQTLASNADLTNLARGHIEESGLMKGWRRTVVGEKLMQLLEGKLSLRLEDGQLRIDRMLRDVH